MRRWIRKWAWRRRSLREDFRPPVGKPWQGRPATRVERIPLKVMAEFEQEFAQDDPALD